MKKNTHKNHVKEASTMRLSFKRPETRQLPVFLLSVSQQFLQLMYLTLELFN